MHVSKFFCMEVLHGEDFVFKEINSRDASVNLSGSKQTFRSSDFFVKDFN